MLIYQGRGVVDSSPGFVKGVVPLSGMALHVASTMGSLAQCVLNIHVDIRCHAPDVQPQVHGPVVGEFIYLPGFVGLCPISCSVPRLMNFGSIFLVLKHH